MSQAANQFDAIEVLTRPTGERDQFCALVGTAGDDEGLIREMLASRAGALSVRASVPALAGLAAIVRAHEAFVSKLIDLDELRRGVEAWAETSHGFERYGPARVWLRTVQEVLADSSLDQSRVARQLGGLHGLMLQSLCEQLTGDEAGRPEVPASPLVSTDSWREEFRITDVERARQLDVLVRECLDGPPNYSGGGFGAAAFVRGWIAIPVFADRVGDAQGEAVRIAAVLAEARSPELIQVKRRASSRYQVHGAKVVVGDGLRPSFAFRSDEAAVQTALDGDRGRCLFTSAREDFFILEDEDHYVVAAPKPVAEQLCGGSKAECMARFREAVEAQEVDGDIPDHLLKVERRYARLRPRGNR